MTKIENKKIDKFEKLYNSCNYPYIFSLKKRILNLFRDTEVYHEYEIRSFQENEKWSGITSIIIFFSLIT